MVEGAARCALAGAVSASGANRQSDTRVAGCRGIRAARGAFAKTFAQRAAPLAASPFDGALALAPRAAPLAAKSLSGGFGSRDAPAEFISVERMIDS